LTDRDVDRVPCGYLTCTSDGTITDLNETFTAWTGLQRDELVGRRTFVEILTAGGRIYHDTHFSPMLHLHGRIEEIAFDVVGSDGDRLPVLVNAVLDRTESGEPTSIRLALFPATERRRYERELVEARKDAEASELRAANLAQTLQRTLIPPTPVAVPGLDVSAAYRPAGRGDEVGGDFYDVFEVREGDWVAVVGDVCGKGAEAAVVTAAARHALRTLTLREAEPSRVLWQLNEVLLGGAYGRYCTVALARLREEHGQWTATVACGGHPLPVLTNTDSGRRVGHPGSLVGVFADVTFRDETFRLASGDRLVMYTDGVTEARRGDDLYGDERLLMWLRDHSGSASDVTAGLLQEVVTFQGGLPLDDIVILALDAP
jgi:phosphoserine phosphatase RsbU/P